MFQSILTPAAGKRLIARAVARHEAITGALANGTIVIVAGTTNRYVAEELLAAIGRAGAFTGKGFFRGLALPPGKAAGGKGKFPGDVVIRRGALVEGATIFDLADNLVEGDVVLKGANAFNPLNGQAGVLIGHPKGGTIVAALQAVVGRRARLILPVGLEKRVPGDLHQLARGINLPGNEGSRLLPVCGEIVSEIEAIAILTGCRTQIVAAGGVGGAEGAVWLAISGDGEAEESARELIRSVEREPPFALD